MILFPHTPKKVLVRELLKYLIILNGETWVNLCYLPRSISDQVNMPRVINLGLI